MKNTLTNLLHASIIAGVYFVSAFNLQAQNNKMVNYTEEEKKSIEVFRKDGASDADIDKWLMKRKLVSLPEKNNTDKNRSGQPPVVNATCGDMGGENGWSSWSASTGDYSNGVITFNAQGIAPTAPRFRLTTGGGVDNCTPGIAPGAPPLPVVAPGFGTRSIQMGELMNNGMNGGCNLGCVERLTYPFTVTVNDTNFIYSYAIVLENPTNVHVGKEVPYAEIYILDGTTVIPCSYQKYTGDTTGTSGTVQPGFYAATCAGPGNGQDVVYKPWTTVGINLNKYVGKTLTVVITNVDCALGGHFCHSYWDFACPPIKGTDPPYCVGAQVTLVAPPSDPTNPYTYQWYVNGTPYGSPIATSMSITPIPQVGDTFAVHVHQPSGCDFWIPYAPQPSTIKADFNFNGNCGKMNFTDLSVVTPVSSTNTVVAWNWSFPGGTPATSTAQNPGTVTYPAGTYTVTLITTSTAGCKDTIKHSFSVGGFPTAAFLPTSPCLGVATTLLDGSLASTGDPIASWNWIMPGGTPSSATSTSASSTHSVSTIYATAGTHIVTLIVTSATGCIDTVTQQVLVYSPPVANFVTPVKGCKPVNANYKDISNPVDGTIAAWEWSMPGGVPSSSTVSAPSNIQYNNVGTYSVSLIVTTNYGCKDTITLPMVEVYPWPTSDFCVAPSKAPTTAPLFNFCDMWSADVVKWQWDFGDGSALDTSSTDPIHSYSATATNNDFYKYNICIRVQNQYGCWDTTCHPVELIPEFTFYIPNTFTPNGDHINEMFYGKCRGVKEYDIWVFDRWGNQLWDCHHDDKNTNWDSDITNPRQEGLSSFCQWDGVVVKGGMDMGGNSGDLAQEDVYVWKVKLLDIFDKRHTYIGHVNIVR